MSPEVAALGVLGGTFNPPHLGHLAVARRALEALRLDLVLLMPARIPPHKPGGEDPGAEHRLRMCRLAVAGSEGVEACGLEIAREGPSYTVDTLRAIHAGHPHAELTFIVGADIASTLPSWREPGQLLELAGIAVAERAGSGRGPVLDALASIPRGADAGPTSVRFLEMEPIDVSSSMARRRAAAGEPIDDLVGPAVAAYIREHGLYRTPAGALV